MYSWVHEQTKNLIFFTYIYILFYQYQFSLYLAGCLRGEFKIYVRYRLNDKFLFLTSCRYVFNIMQTPVNKQHYWMALTLVHPNDVYLGMA